jgi:arylsulfatase A-like enzyme
MTLESLNDRKFENVVVISLDCVRREALGCYPHRFPWPARFLQTARTPNIDRLCADGTRFDQAVTHAPFTPAAHASIFTGLIPPQHGLRRFVGTRLNESSKLLAEILSAAGWACGAVVGSHALSREFGFAAGFHYYDDDIQSGIKRWHKGERRNADEVTDRALAWLKSLAKEQRFFLFVHYFDAHNLSAQPKDYASGMTQGSSPNSWRRSLRNILPGPIQAILRPVDQLVRRLWYAALEGAYRGIDWGLGYFEAGRRFRGEGRRYMLKQTSAIDTQIGRLIQALTDQDRLDKTLCIVLADHGDDFMEHGEPTHRQYLFDSTLVVPLIIYPRPGPRSEIQEQVRLVDLFPTILSTLGIEHEGGIDGDNLQELTENRTTSVREAYSETLYERIVPGHDETDVLTCFASLRVYPWKLIWNRLSDDYELYRLDIDPQERVDVADKHRDVVTTLSGELRQMAGEMPVNISETETDDILIERLTALGYLQ